MGSQKVYVEPMDIKGGKLALLGYTKIGNPRTEIPNNSPVYLYID